MMSDDVMILDITHIMGNGFYTCDPIGHMICLLSIDWLMDRTQLTQES